MVCVSAGITQIVRNDTNGLISGIVLLIFGFGFIMWREWLKIKYQKKKGNNQRNILW